MAELIAGGDNDGAQRAFALYMEQHKRRLFAFVVGRKGIRWADGADFVEDTFLAFWQKIKEPRYSEVLTHPDSLLYSIARKKVLDRKYLERRKHEVAALEADDESPVHHPRQLLHPLEERVLRRELRSFVKGELSSKERVVFHGYLQDTSHEQIAEVLGCSVSCSRVLRLRVWGKVFDRAAKLRAELGGVLEGTEPGGEE